MKIVQPSSSVNSIPDMQYDLALLVQQPGPQARAICPGCRQYSAEKCSPKCTEAARALSIDPEQYPLERNVVALVYELAATRLFQTCWSCEGHMDENNHLWKVPQVCFYVSSPVYVKLLSQYLTELQQKKNLTYPWHIVIVDFGQTNDLTYSLQPDLNTVSDPHLGKLQMDMKVIAEGLHQHLKHRASQLLAKSSF